MIELILIVLYTLLLVPFELNILELRDQSFELTPAGTFKTPATLVDVPSLGGNEPLPSGPFGNI